MVFLTITSEHLSTFGFLALGVLLVPALLALSAVRSDVPGAAYFRAFAICLFGIWVPILVFVLRSGLTPEAKDEARGGWLDCFGSGSIWMFPLVLFASWGFHRLLVLRRGEPAGRWTAAAICTGTIVSWGCTVFWFVRVALGGRAEMVGMMVVPVYVSAWYMVLSLRVFRESGGGWLAAVGSSLATIPFWIASVVASKRFYAVLPETASDCFVVTAVGNGHVRVVGPFLEVERRGQKRMVNRQLARFWEFEAAWNQRYPKFHGAFRAIYNRVGPIAAGCIRQRFLADVAYLMLKPIELVCVALLRGKR